MLSNPTHTLKCRSFGGLLEFRLCPWLATGNHTLFLEVAIKGQMFIWGFWSRSDPKDWGYVISNTEYDWCVFPKGMVSGFNVPFLNPHLTSFFKPMGPALFSRGVFELISQVQSSHFSMVSIVISRQHILVVGFFGCTHACMISVCLLMCTGWHCVCKLHSLSVSLSFSLSLTCSASAVQTRAAPPTWLSSTRLDSSHRRIPSWSPRDTHWHVWI